MTFVPPFKDPSNYRQAEQAQLSHKKKAERRQTHRRSCSKVAVIAKWRHSDCYIHRPMHAFAHPGEAWKRHMGGRSITQIEGLSFAAECICHVETIGQPLCIHSATTAMCLSPFCLIWATFKLPNFSVTIIHVQNVMATVVSTMMSEHAVYHIWPTKATMLHLF